MVTVKWGVGAEPGGVCGGDRREFMTEVVLRFRALSCRLDCTPQQAASIYIYLYHYTAPSSVTTAVYTTSQRHFTPTSPY